MIEIIVNGQAHQVEVEPDTPLLWVLREQLGMTGTRFGCGVGMCGACTVHIDGAPTRTCVLPVAAAAGQEITTIEGLAHPTLQQAWLDEQVPQCGYCQSGQLMQAAGLLSRHRDPDDAQIGAYMTNLCRCATYDRIRAAIHLAASRLPAPIVPGAPQPEESAEEADAEEDAGSAGGAALPPGGVR